MIKSFITKTRWLVTIILLTTLAVGQMWGAAAELPINYSFGSGKSSLPTGVTDPGNTLGSDYAASNSPYRLKFDGNSDYIQVEVDGAVQDITIGVKQYASTAPKFQIKGCATSGGTYSDLGSYTFSVGQNKTGTWTTTTSISSTYRFFRIYKTAGGNAGLGTLVITKACNAVDVTGGNTIIFPKGSTSYSAGDWAAKGAPTAYAAQKIYTVNDYCITLTQSADFNDGNGLQCKASSAGIVSVVGITSNYGIDVEFLTGNSTTFNVALTGASSKSSQSGTVTISTTSTTATLTITKAGSGVGYLKYIKITPKASSCGVPTALTKGSINASSQTVSWTAPASAPANGYLVAYSTATSDNPADNIYSTSGNYTVMAISAGTTTANIPCNSAGTYNWWVRSKCSADNSSLSSWVKGTAFTMKQIYLQVNDNWANDNANFCAYYWNADPKTGFTKIMTEQEDCEEKIYTCVFPTDYSNMKFVRLNPIQVDPVVNFDNRWNETGNLTLAADKNYYQITGGTGSSVTGSWTTYAQKVKVLFSKNTSADGVTNPDYQCVVKSSGKATAPTISDMSHDYLGYQLNGWWTAADGGTQINFSTQTFTANETTLHAHWTAGATTPIALKTTWSDQDWRTGNCIVYAHCYIDGTNQFQDILMTGNVCDDYLIANAPYGTTHVSFARCKAGTSLPLGDWASNSNVNNYVAGMTIGGTNTYEITGWGDYGQKVGTATKAGSAYVAPTYTVSFANGGGSGTMTSHTGIACNTSQTLKQNTFEKDYYHFSAWHANVATKVGGETVDAGDDIADQATLQNITGNIALTAQWAPDEYSVTATLTNVTPNSAFPSSFTYTGSSTTALNRTLSAATGYNLPENITVTMGGSTLTKGTHYTYSNANGAFAFTATITGNIVITVSGVAKTYGNTLEREGGTTGSTSVTTTYNSNTLTSYTAPTKTGYTFGGYWSGDDGTGTEVINTSGALKASVTVSAVAWTNSSSQWVKDGAVTMYAKWTAKNYTVTLNDGSGSGGSGSKSVTYNANTNLTTNVAVPTYAGNDFRGYYTSAGGSGTKVIDGNGAWIRGTSYVDASGNWVYDGSPTLHAYYTAYEYENYRTNCSDMYDIVLDDGLVATTNNGSAKVAANGTTLTSIVAPTKSGYDIEGYYTTSGLATKIATDAGALSKDVTVSGDDWTNGSNQWVLGAGATFYTKWSAHTYTITYEGLEGASNTNPTSYNIETATIVLANPGSRTGYTFSGWTLGGDAITQITVGSTGDKTITANWTINQHAVTVSAADHVVITATPASEAAIAEGANRNVNYNKTITLNCTPDAHWNLAWDVYKTGETATKVAVTGSGDGATFTMPDYAVTVTAVMTEDTYHTATFKNNGIAIDGYDGVKTYDGTRPSAPTLTDVTDACDKTDCNKFYGWIAEDGIWNKTIDNVAGKTIYRRASDIPNVSGADVVYHAVWAKGEAGPELSAPTPIIYWARQSIAASTDISATSGTGTLNSNVAFTDDTYEKVYNSGTLSSYPTITLSGLDMSGATGSTVNISFFTRGTNASAGDLTVKYTDSGNEYTAGTVTVVSKQICYHEVSGIPKTATQIKLEHDANSGNLAIGTIKIFEPLTTSYTFTELTSENTSGWANADWDGYYLITNGQVSLQALNGNGIGEKNITSVTASAGVISTTNAGAAFKVTWVSGSGYKMQGVGSGDYLNTASNSVAPSASVVYMSEIGYNSITDGSSNKLYWNSSKFGFYSSTQTSPVLYKIMESFTEFRITCCTNEITIGSPTKTGSGTVTFASGGDPVDEGGKVETCYGATTITATVTPSNGYQCTVLSFTRSDSEDLTPDPAISVPFTGAQNYDLTFEQNADGVTLNTTVTFVALIDHYIDNMHYNTTINKSGGYGDGKAPTLSDETKGEQCTGLHYRFIGWIPEIDMNMETGVPTTTANMVAGGQTGMYATGTNYYAIWAEEE